jgi:hypothetical protein
MNVIDARFTEQAAIRTQLGAIFTSLELSRSTWLITSISPGGREKMSKQVMRAGDVAGLLARFMQIKRRRCTPGRDRTSRSSSFKKHAWTDFGSIGCWSHRGITGNAADDLNELVRILMIEAQGELIELDRRIASYDRRIRELYRTSKLCQRLGKIEGIGPVTATALAAAVGDRSCFKNGRQFAAQLGLVPKQRSSNGQPNCSASANAATAICVP